MFFLLCVCECSLTSAKSVQPDLFKVSANEANIKGKESILYGGRSLCYDLGNLPGRFLFVGHGRNAFFLIL